MSIQQSGAFSHHGIVCFEYNAVIKALTRFRRSVYYYSKADFDCLHASLAMIGLSSLPSCDDIDADWLYWKDAFLSAVADHVPTKWLKGRNHVPWITGTLINTINKKETGRLRLKKNPSNSTLKEKHKFLRSEKKRLLRKSKDNYLGSLKTDYG